VGVTQLPSSLDRVIVAGAFLTLEPHTLFRAFTEPAFLVRWWPQGAPVDLPEAARTIWRGLP
jgi:uncharacterized protein YndB with AHSA1/START domain